MMDKAKIYTRTGDSGQTSLVGGQRVSKASQRLEAYGTVDELSSTLGLLATYLTEETDRNQVETIQQNLFYVAASLATPPQHEGSKDRSSDSKRVLDASLVENIETEIDQISATLPPLRSFILPGGTRGAAVAHICRTICRRAERRIIALSKTAPVDPILLSYVNRISDYLFVLARKLNFLAGRSEKNMI